LLFLPFAISLHLDKTTGMALIQEMERQGNRLFRYRGQIPIVLFLLVIPVLYLGAGTTVPAWLLPLAAGISVSGAIVRAYTIGTTPRGTSGRNTKQQVAESLNTSGIYSVVRHPLYLGNYLMWIGIVAYSGSIGFVVLVTLLYWLYYERIMMAEEAFLMNKFGTAYREWSAKVPAFIPRFSAFTAPSVSFSLRSVFRREYSGWLATVVGFAYVDCVRILTTVNSFNMEALRTCWSYWRIPLVVVLLCVLLLRTLKHHTRVLLEEGRS
jgi:protein-S-isoprenylcysteine O-methyltransferase Ste14